MNLRAKLMVPFAALFCAVAAYLHFVALPRAIAETEKQFHMQVDGDVSAIAEILRPAVATRDHEDLHQKSDVYFKAHKSWHELLVTDGDGRTLVHHRRGEALRAADTHVHTQDVADSYGPKPATITVIADISDRLDGVRESYKHFMLILAGAMAFSLALLASLLWSIVLKPIGDVVRAADRLIERDFSQPQLKVSDDEVGHLAQRVSDLSVALRQHEFNQRNSALTIASLAFHDDLTGLPNRAFLQDRLSTELNYASVEDRSIALMFFDIDNFKSINDLEGHGVGDQCLREIAHRLVASAAGQSSLVCDLETMHDGLVDGSTFVARYSADVFAVVMTRVEASELNEIVGHIQSSIHRTFVTNGREFDFTVSAGISVFPKHGATTQDLIQHADTALHAAKRDTHSDVRFFSDTLDSTNFRRLSLESALPRAAANGEVQLHYQAKVDVRSGLISGVEALARWSHPIHGNVSPGEFIPISERQGSIVELGQWVIESACAQAVQWQRSGLPAIRMAVNLSPRQFGDPSLVERVSRAIAAHDLDPGLLELELTEGALVEDPDRAERVLAELKDLGVYLSVDDFGTGYSSLSYLHRFPIDAVKIDRSFINTISDDAGSRAIVTAIISMARELNMTVVAEGVETSDQLRFLVSAGCDDAQGFFLSKPIEPESFEKSFEDTVNWTLAAVREIAEDVDNKALANATDTRH